MKKTTWIHLLIAVWALSCFEHAEGDDLNQIRFDWTSEGTVGFSYYGPGLQLTPAVVRDAIVKKHDAKIIQVELIDHKIVPVEIEAIASLQGVKRLTLGEYPTAVSISQRSISELGTLSMLERLSIYGEVLPTVDWRSLGDLQSLVELVLSGDVTLRTNDLNALSKLTRLEYVELSGDVSLRSFDWLKDLRQLRRLDLETHGADTDAIPISSDLPSLQHLRLKGVAFDSSEIKRLSDSLGESLIFLDIEIVSPDSMKSLTEFRNVAGLVVTLAHDCECDLSFVAKLPKLKTLCIRGCSSPQSQVTAVVQQHPSLTSVLLTDHTGTRHFRSTRRRNKTGQGQ